MSLPIHIVYFSVLFAAVSNAQAVLSLTPNVSASTAYGVSQTLSPAFAGLGIEPSNLFSFTGHSTVNQLSVQLLNNLANYTGIPPHLRIGGNTEDNIIYDATFNGFYLQQNPNPTGQGNVPSDLFTIGPNFFAAIDRFPAGTPITYGLNLAYDGSDHIDRIVAEATAASSMLKNTALVSFEIGNEPDLYLQNMFRNGSWTGTNYVTDWLPRAQAVYDQVLKPKNISANYFEPACTASTIGTTFAIDQLAQNGLLAPAANQPAGQNSSFISTWNQHDYYYYIGVSGYALDLDNFLDLSRTTDQFLNWVTQSQQAFTTGHTYVLREMASVGPVGQQGISDVFGATLWTLNFFLYTASINISSVEMHMTDNSYAAPWQPIEMNNSPPHVRSTYSAFAAMAQLIGGGCTTQVAQMTISQSPAGYPNRLAAYTTYQEGQAAAFVLMNTALSNASNTSPGSVSFDLSLPALAGQTLYLSYLTAPGADSLDNTTWNGMSYTVNANGVPANVVNDTRPVQIGSNGAVSIPVRDSQAVIANVGYQIGTGPKAEYNESACQKLASSSTVPSELQAPLARISSVAAAASASSISATAHTSSPTTTNGGVGPDALHSGGSPRKSSATIVSPSLGLVAILSSFGVVLGLLLL